MTREKLTEILETFAVLVLKTGMSDMDTNVQYSLISAGIEDIADAVMFCNDRDRLSTPSIN